MANVSANPPGAWPKRRPPGPRAPGGMRAGIERCAAEAPLLSQAEEEELVARWSDHRDPSAYDALVRSHVRLVLSIASRYRHHRPGLEDLAQEGVLGLARAIERFRPSKGARLGTLATWWIRSSIQAAVYRGSSIVRPPNTNPNIRQFFRGRASEVTGGHPEDVPIDVPGPWEGASSFLDTIARGGETPEEHLARLQGEHAERAALARGLASLSERELSVVQARHSGGKVALGEIGREFGVSSERVRQLEARALRKLRDHLEGVGRHA